MRRKTLKLFYIPKRQNRGFKNNKKQKLIDILLKAEKLWLIIPLILYGIGFFIHNVYLSNYNTFDFEIIQTKYIYIGIIFTIYILLFILLMTLSVGNPRNTEKQELIIISSWLIRIPILAFCIYFLLYDFDTVNNDIKLLLGKYFTSTLLSIIHSIILLLALLYVSWFLFYNYSKLLKDKNIDKAIKIFFSIVLIPLAFTSLTYATISQNFSRLLGFLVIPFFLILIFGLLYTKIDQSKFLKEKLPISNFLFGTIMILIIFYFSIIYARNIYPQIPMNYGGAKPVHAILFTPIDTIYCNILNENSDWLLIKRDDDNFTEKIRSNSLQNILISDLIKSHTVSK